MLSDQAVHSFVQVMDIFFRGIRVLFKQWLLPHLYNRAAA